MSTSITALLRSLAPYPLSEADLDDLALGAPAFLPVVPTARLWLPKVGFGDDERFALVFRDTWHKLPLRARRPLVKHWREDSRRFPIQGPWSPLIQLAEHWAFSDRAIRRPKDMAACGRNGHSLFFYAPIVDAMPVRHVEELVAHELAHAVLCAKGERLPTDRNRHRWLDAQEIMADEIMELWGFDPDAVDAWVEQNWKWTSDKETKGKKRK